MEVRDLLRESQAANQLDDNDSDGNEDGHDDSDATTFYDPSAVTVEPVQSPQTDHICDDLTTQLSTDVKTIDSTSTPIDAEIHTSRSEERIESSTGQESSDELQAIPSLKRSIRSVLARHVYRLLLGHTILYLDRLCIQVLMTFLQNSLRTCSNILSPILQIAQTKTLLLQWLPAL